jgi:hypothetical protein
VVVQSTSRSESTLASNMLRAVVNEKGQSVCVTERVPAFGPRVPNFVV